MKTIPMTIETIVPRIRYATALLIDMSIGPILSSGPHVWSSHSCEGSNFDSSSGSVCANASDGRVSASSEDCGERALHAFASPPKYVARPTPSSTVNAIA